MAGFNDHEIKRVIREQWCKPLIKHISEKLGMKLTYFGLPGIDAIDVLTWIDYIDNVIAFEIGDYSRNYNDENAKINIKKLNGILNALEVNEKLETYSLYHGNIEEVIFKGFDRNGYKFSQESCVRIYNLDFCNSLTSPVTVVDYKGNVLKYYKSEVIKKLLEIQRDIAKSDKESRFILLLTVNSYFMVEAAQAEKVLSGSYYNEIYKKYLQNFNELGENEKSIRILRLYLISILSQQFCSCQFIPEFFPTLYYNGFGENTKMLCFTIMGTFVENPGGIAPFGQNIETLINAKFLNPIETGIENLIQDKIKETNCSIDPIKNIESFQSFNELWK